MACHGIPDTRRLKDGDIVSVDISVCNVESTSTMITHFNDDLMRKQAAAAATMNRKDTEGYTLSKEMRLD